MDGDIETIAIIGAGMAGLACAGELERAGYRVALFDKGRGPGGRMSARRAEVDGQTVGFDHGAQFFTARDPAFRAKVESWEKGGIASRWPAAGDEAWVGTPAMNAPIRAMADELNVDWGTCIESVQHDGNKWLIKCEGRSLTFDAIGSAVPAEQAVELLEPVAPALAEKAAAVRSEPCWAVMAGFAKRLDLPNCLPNEEGAIAWAARNSSKPGRNAGENWVIHASPNRTRELLDMPRDEAAKHLLDDFFAQTGIAPVWPVHLAAHRWLYAKPVVGRVGPPCHWDDRNRIGICGDYLHSPHVEGAFLSGRALADAISASSR